MDPNWKDDKYWMEWDGVYYFGPMRFDYDLYSYHFAGKAKDKLSSFEFTEQYYPPVMPESSPRNIGVGTRHALGRVSTRIPRQENITSFAKEKRKDLIKRGRKTGQATISRRLREGSLPGYPVPPNIRKKIGKMTGMGGQRRYLSKRRKTKSKRRKTKSKRRRKTTSKRRRKTTSKRKRKRKSKRKKTP